MATGGVVGNMVCPLCARMHGKPHAETCPRTYDGPNPEVYQMGYVGAEHQKHEVVEFMQTRLARIFEVFALAEQEFPELREACCSLLPLSLA